MKIDKDTLEFFLKGSEAHLADAQRDTKQANSMMEHLVDNGRVDGALVAGLLIASAIKTAISSTLLVLVRLKIGESDE